MDFYILKLTALFAVGFIAAVINTMAGGGSFLTIPLLIFIGLPPTVANATNRLGVFLQALTVTRTFGKHGYLPWKFSIWVSVPAVAGAILGAYLATIISDEAFKKYFAIIMIIMTFVTVLSPQKADGALKLADKQFGKLLICIMFFFIGIYGGFIQAGVGFLLIAAMTISGFDLLTSNAVKMFITLVFTAFALVIFIAYGKIDWPLGIVLAAGNIAGAYVGANISVKRGAVFLRKVVLGAAVVFAVILLFS